MSRIASSRIYDFYSGFYDVFEILFRRRIGRAMARIPFQQGDRVLDIGVGTGITLRYYPEFVHVTGVDNCIRMLSMADKKIRDGLVQAPTRLLQADALELPFPGRKFDVVVLSHVIATVRDPQRCLAEALRVTRDQGFILLINHFRSTNPWMDRLETWIDPLCRRLGWRNDLRREDLLANAGVRQAGHADPARGKVFQTVYLQKQGDTARVISLPKPAEYEASEPRTILG
jgi:phosphatidylethanolamine/phosphatidyl-N-methylethanolamine N-methyltransferase